MGRKFEPTLSWLWWFIWDDDSICSWIANIVIAFVLIKFIVYPGLGLLLSTSHPVVAVVSGSMEHDGSFDSWWAAQGGYYTSMGITKEQFKSFSFRNGFNKGDIIILKGKGFDKIEKGDIVVYRSAFRAEPVIHRAVKVFEENGVHYVQAKGDHNNASNPDELKLTQSQYIGNGMFRIPLLGWVKIAFVALLRLAGAA